MKYAAVLFALCASAAAAQPSQRVADLRQVLQQYDPGAVQPRQLTAVERAELRKQLAESAGPPRPRKNK